MKIRPGLIFTVLLALALIGLLMESGMKVCLFSATRGVVTRNGAPVANAEVERTYKWGWMAKADSDKTRTDAQGRFSFDTAWDWSVVHTVVPILHESVSQKIFIRVDGSEYEAWNTSKSNFKDLGEVGRPLELMCELTAPDRNRKTHSGIAELAP